MGYSTMLQENFIKDTFKKSEVQLGMGSFYEHEHEHDNHEGPGLVLIDCYQHSKLNYNCKEGNNPEGLSVVILVLVSCQLSGEI